MPSQTRFVNNVISAEWANPANAFLENDLCTSTKTDDASNYYNFINNPFTIPAGATITGIRANWRWGGDGNDWFTLALRDASPAWTKAYGQPPVASCADAVLIGAGGEGNLWGASWTPAHINSANFECWFFYEKSGKANFLYIDFLEIIVYYTVPGVPYAANVRLMGTVIAPYSAPVRNIGSVYRSYSAQIRNIGNVVFSYSSRVRLIGVVLLPFTARVRNIGTVIASFSAQVRNVGTILIPYSARVRLVGTVVLPFSAQVRNIGLVYRSFSTQVRNVGTILIPYSSSVRNIGIIPLVVAKCHAELSVIRRRIF